MKTLIISLLLLFVAPAASVAQTASALPASAAAAVPVHFTIDVVYLSSTIDPATGMLVTTAVSSTHGSFGKTTGTMHIELDPATGAFTGTRNAVAADGSTLSIAFGGQFLDAIHSVGTYVLVSGTGRYANMSLSGSFSATEWTTGVAGNTTLATGTASL